MSAAPDFSAWSTGVLTRTEAALADFLPPAQGASAELDRLHAAMRYAVLEGGKRVRPLLVFAAGEVSAAPPAALDCAACGVELIHAYSLVHDDLPCMDNDVLRRGKPTVHVAYGEALAMLVGDALQALAFRAVAHAVDQGVAPAAVVRMTQTLAEAAGSLGMAGGQAIDLAAVGARIDQAALSDMHRRKTGAMLRASVLLGAWAGEPLPAAALAGLNRYCEAVGLAFQVVDDILDVTADTATLGKTAGKDEAQDKPTYVSLLGLEAARRFAESLREEALSALAALGPLQSRAARLIDLADLIVHRRA